MPKPTVVLPDLGVFIYSIGIGEIDGGRTGIFGTE